MVKDNAKKAIAVLSLLHMGVDFLCAFALFGRFLGTQDNLFFLYNFCAFALQLPFGMVLDEMSKKTEKKYLPALWMTFSGILLTLLGTLFSPLLLGLGNAFFHVGGGVLTIHEDDRAVLDGRGLGVFVAPGAIGLALGMLLKGKEYFLFLGIVAVMMLLLCLLLWKERDRLSGEPAGESSDTDGTLIMIAFCFLVVVLRSFVGMSVSFSWKQGTVLTLLSVLALALGKSAGGFLAHAITMRKTILLSLLLSTIFFALGETVCGGLAALFFFNMSMPLTLYLLAGKLPAAPGFAFGLLTFGLFLGYVPLLYGLVGKTPPFPCGSLGSLVSLVLLLLAERKAV